MPSPPFLEKQGDEILNGSKVMIFHARAVKVENGRPGKEGLEGYMGIGRTGE